MASQNFVALLAILASCTICMQQGDALRVSPDAFVSGIPEEFMNKLKSDFRFPVSVESLPEEHMNVSQMINYFGYPVEQHNVVTEDGYILSLQRIPRGRSGVPPNGEAIFLQHGLVSSGADWVMNLPHQSLGFILADQGYDVWIGNSRGNTYSNKHIKWTGKDDEFWAFSWDEMAKYDLPACVNYVTKVAGVKKIFYVGHSQGTLMAFAEFSRNQEIADKIHLFVALAPVMVVGHLKGAIKIMSYFSPEIELLFKILGVKQFLPNNALINFLADKVCDHHIAQPACSSFIFLLCGYDSKNLNETRLPIYFSHTPAGTSVQDVVHFAQMARSKKFQMYDYGYYGNYKHYKQFSAPLYDVSTMKVPTALYTATNDWLADPEDVAILTSQLNSIVEHKNIENWNHLDFIWGEDANVLIYKDILKLLQGYRNS